MNIYLERNIVLLLVTSKYWLGLLHRIWIYEYPSVDRRPTLLVVGREVAQLAAVKQVLHFYSLSSCHKMVRTRGCVKKGCEHSTAIWFLNRLTQTSQHD